MFGHFRFSHMIGIYGGAVWRSEAKQVPLGFPEVLDAVRLSEASTALNARTRVRVV